MQSSFRLRLGVGAAILAALLPVQVQAVTCDVGKPCGDTCISTFDTCHAGVGSAGRAGGEGDATTTIIAFVVGIALTGFFVWLFTRDDRAPQRTALAPAWSPAPEPDAPVPDAAPLRPAEPSAACAETDRCLRLGECSMRGSEGPCLAGSDADCKPSAACRLAGRCKAVDGKCVSP